MWQDGEDFNFETGEPVKLYQPAQGPPRRANHHNNTSSSSHDSHIGGTASVNVPIPSCDSCQDPMFLLVQLHHVNLKSSGSDGADADADKKKVDRTLCVYGCPRAKCSSSISFSKGFTTSALTKNMRCHRIQTESSSSQPAPVAPVATTKAAWYNDDNDKTGDAAMNSNNDNDNEDDNDWDMDDEEDKAGAASLEDLENAVSAMEVKEATGAVKQAKKNVVTSNDKTDDTFDSSSMFKCYTLMESREPLAQRTQIEEDDVGLSYTDDKVRNMLARYMEEEEDTEVLNALKGVGGSSSGGKGGGEEDERLTDQDRIFFSFQDRLKRLPRQVVRRAPQGIPIWSIPVQENAFQVEPCSCGAPRVFDCQLLPSLLEKLEVDQYSQAKPLKGKANVGALLSEGMNWGSVAVYVCSKACSNQEEFLVIQESVDVAPAYNNENGDMEEEEDDDEDIAPPTIAVMEDLDDDDEFTPDA